MSKTENPKHLSLLESIHAGSDGEPKGGVQDKRIAAQPRASSSDGSIAKLNVLDEHQKAPAEPEGERGPIATRQAPQARGAGVDSATETLTFELPRRRKRRPIGGYISFVLCVLLPTILAGVYYFVFASDQYVVQFRFAVRDTSTAVSTSAATSDLTSMVGISSTSNPTENYMVTEFMTSQQAVEELQSRIKLRELYSRPFIDFASRMDASAPIEAFSRYWKNMVTAQFDQVTGIAWAEVRAFTADDAYLIAKTLLSLGEDLINEVAQRPQREAMRYAEAEVARAEDRLRKVRAELAQYRDKTGLIEPNSSVVMANATVASTIRSSLAQIQTDMAVLRKQGVGGNAAQMQTLQTRLKATEEQLKAVENQISTATSGESSISQAVARYEQLDLERLFAQNLLTSTMQSLEQARSNAATKRIYVVAFVQPALPQVSTYPRRYVATLTVAIACLLLWTIALLVGRSIKEHLA